MDRFSAPLAALGQILQRPHVRTVVLAVVGFLFGGGLGLLRPFQVLPDGGWFWLIPGLLGSLLGGLAALVIAGRQRLGELHDEAARRSAAEEEALRVAMHDPLTGLANRWLTENRVGRAIGHGKRSGAPFLLILADVGNLRQIQSLWGRDAADSVLRTAAGRLGGLARAGDTVGRIEESQFALLHVPLTDRNDVDVLIKRTAEMLAMPIDLSGGSELQLIPAVGCAVYPDDGAGGADLMRRAGVALARAQTQGGGAARFAPEMEEELTRRAVLEAGIRSGLAAGNQFIPYYQPVYALADRRLTGFEALARWIHPERGMISPADFIPVAENTQLIQPMWEQLFDRVCADLARWPEHLCCAVNLSPLQISDPDIVPKLLAICARHNVSPARIEAEITETGLFSSTAQAELVIRALKHVGVKMVLDDFGQAYSNFSRLIALAFDKIKIDQLYVRGMADDPTKRAIVQTMIFLSHRLGIPVNAEGIEDEGLVIELVREACTLGQGFHLGRPMPAASVDKLLADLATAAE